MWRFRLKRPIKAVLWLDLLQYILGDDGTKKERKKKKCEARKLRRRLRRRRRRRCSISAKKTAIVGSANSCERACRGKVSHRRLHTRGGEVWWLSLSVTPPLWKVLKEWNEVTPSPESRPICLIHECAFEFAWLLVQLPPRIGRRRTQGADTRRRLSPREEVMRHPSAFDIYSKNKKKRVGGWRGSLCGANPHQGEIS